MSRHKASSAGRTQSIREQGALQQDSNGLRLLGQKNANLGYGIGVRGEGCREPTWGVTALNSLARLPGAEVRGGGPGSERRGKGRKDAVPGLEMEGGRGRRCPD